MAIFKIFLSLKELTDSSSDLRSAILPSSGGGMDDPDSAEIAP